jgi:hypothetical protein
MAGPLRDIAWFRGAPAAISSMSDTLASLFLPFLFESHKKRKPNDNLIQEPHAFARRIPLVVSHLRLAQIIEIIFSGFEIDLYLPNEKPFLYWYLLQSVLPHANNVLCDLSEMMKEGRTNDREPL